jgi:ACS family hexuronate transporter-like MFS transporter
MPDATVSPAVSNAPGAAAARTNFRWVICGLLFWVTTANYIDRGVFGNLAPELKKTIGWSDEQYWYMTMAFSCAYAFSMVFMGRIMDVLGLRWGFVFACAFWGVASMSHALASTVTGFFICRIFLGFGEGGNFPAAIKTTAEWFPKRERALATGLFNSGSNVGGVFVPWALPVLLAHFSVLTIGGWTVGWRGAFIVTAMIDLCWIFAWLALYRKPEEHPRVNAAELQYIQSDSVEGTVKIPWPRLIPHRQMWAFAIAKLMTDCFWWFYLFGAPDFFKNQFKLDADERKYELMMIYVVASVGSIAGGYLAGYFMKIGWSTNRARKTTLLICALCVAPVALCGSTTNKWIAAVLITLAASAHQAWSANAFSLVGDMFPRRAVGSVTGLGGMFGALGGVGLQFITAKVLHNTGSYYYIFLFAGASYLLAILLIHLVVPKLEPVRIEELTAAD